jgi:hypothetical protein
MIVNAKVDKIIEKFIVIALIINNILNIYFIIFFKSSDYLIISKSNTLYKRGY